MSRKYRKSPKSKTNPDENKHLPQGFDKWPFELFMQEIHNQSQMALFAINDLIEITSKKPLDNMRFWYSVHGFLAASANISKLLTYSDYSFRNESSSVSLKEKNKELKQNLRSFLQIDSNSEVLNRTFRNHYEHYDERLFKWSMRVNGKSIMLHYTINSPETFRAQLGLDANVAVEPLKCFDPVNSKLIFYNEILDIDSMSEEIKKINEKSEEYLRIK